MQFRLGFQQIMQFYDVFSYKNSASCAIWGRTIGCYLKYWLLASVNSWQGTLDVQHRKDVGQPWPSLNPTHNVLICQLIIRGCFREYTGFCVKTGVGQHAPVHWVVTISPVSHNVSYLSSRVCTIARKPKFSTLKYGHKSKAIKITIHFCSLQVGWKLCHSWCWWNNLSAGSKFSYFVAAATSTPCAWACTCVLCLHVCTAEP